MISLLRLHGLEFRKMLGFWGLAVIGAIGLCSWKLSIPESRLPAAGICQLIAAPLGMIAALRSDLIAWALPVGRTRRVLSHMLFTAALALLGAVGAIALQGDFGDSPTLRLKLVSLTLSGLLAALALGGIYLMFEESESILARILVLFFIVVDCGLMYWQLAQPFSWTGAWGLTLFTLPAAGFYCTVYFQTELQEPRPAAEFASAPPKSQDSPDRRLLPSRGPAPAELARPDNPESVAGKVVLGISADLRKGHRFRAILLKRGFTWFALMFAFQFGTMFLGSFGFMMSRQYIICSAIGVGQSLITWAFFTHTPLPRWKGFVILILPFMSLWIGIILATLLQVPYSDSTHFLGETRGISSENFTSSRIKPNLECGIDNQTLEEIGFPSRKDGPQNRPENVASLTATFLQAFFGIRTSPEYLLSLRVKSSSPDLIADTDPQQTAWLQAIETRFQPELRWSLFRHRAYSSLTAFLFFVCVLLGVIIANRLSRAKCALLIGVGFAAYVGFGAAEVTSRLFRICDALPWLTIIALPTLIAIAIYISYRVFREWAPVTRRQPLHYRLR